jgi:hypothetical protein
MVQISDVNRYGHVLGMIDRGPGASPRWPSAIWANGRVTVLPSPVADAADCGATRLNDRGQAAGYYTVGGRQHAAVWTAGVPRVLDIGTIYSQATALNNLGQVTVLGYNEPSGETPIWHTVCLVDGTSVTTVSPPPTESGMTFSAVAVNDRSEVLMAGSVPRGVRVGRRPPAGRGGAAHNTTRAKRSALSADTLRPRPSGDGGNRTRVLRCQIRASPSAVRCVFLGPGGHADKPPTGSVTV